LPFLGIVPVALGFGTIWIGEAYGVAFGAGIVLLTALPRPLDVAAGEEPVWIQSRTIALRDRSRVAAIGLLLLIGAALSLALMGM